MEKRGGKREGAGRPRKVDEEKVNTLFETALRQLYKTKSTDEAKTKFILQLLQSPRGELFIAEHIFGKARERLDITTGDQPFNKPLVQFFKTDDTDK